jgi:hypothetical protein
MFFFGVRLPYVIEQLPIFQVTTQQRQKKDLDSGTRRMC